jgi:hypothetical protein
MHQVVGEVCRVQNKMMTVLAKILFFLMQTAYSGRLIKCEAPSFYYGTGYNHRSGQTLQNNSAKSPDRKYYPAILFLMKSCVDI